MARANGLASSDVHTFAIRCHGREHASRLAEALHLVGQEHVAELAHDASCEPSANGSAWASACCQMISGDATAARAYSTMGSLRSVATSSRVRRAPRRGAASRSRSRRRSRERGARRRQGGARLHRARTARTAPGPGSGRTSPGRCPRTPLRYSSRRHGCWMRISIETQGIVTPSGSSTSSSSSGSKPKARYSGTPGSVATSESSRKPSRARGVPRTPRGSGGRGRAASSRARTNIARTLAASVAGSSARASPSASPLPV